MFGGKKRRQAIWTQVALELDGEHHPQSKWWRADECIDAVVNGVDVKLDIYIVSTGKSSHPYTRVTASFAYGPGVKTKVYKQGLLSSIGKALGMRDVALGDAAFDERFIVRAENPAVVRRLWTSKACKLFARRLEDTTVQSDTKTIKVWSAGRWDEAPRMRDAFAMIGELASRDLYGLFALRAIAGATTTSPSGERPCAELDTGVRVVVQAEDHDDHLVMVARAAESLAMEPLVIEVSDGRLVDAERATKLPQAAHAIAHAVGSGTLAIDRANITFAWRSLELDPARLRAGADLIGAIAASARGGVYR